MSTFADPQIVQLLQTRFVPVAIDQHYHRRQQDSEGEFYRKIAGQGPRNNFKSTTQGLYVASADGQFLGFSNHRHPDRIRQMIDQALARFDPGKASRAAPIPQGKIDPRYNVKPPEGGLVVRVQAKVLGGYEETDDPARLAFQTALSRDNMWLSRSEHAALARGELPAAVQQRLARYHLIDNTRGEPPMWGEKEVRALEMQLKDGRLSGRVHLETDDGQRGYQAELLGEVEAKDGRVVRFDCVALGQFWGEGTYTRGAPQGKFPLAVSFTLADGQDAADGVPPQGSRGWVQGYVGRE